MIGSAIPRMRRAASNVRTIRAMPTTMSVLVEIAGALDEIRFEDPLVEADSHTRGGQDPASQRSRVPSRANAETW